MKDHIVKELSPFSFPFSLFSWFYLTLSSVSGETIELLLHLNAMQKFEPILAGVAFRLLLLGLSGSAESHEQNIGNFCFTDAP
jgi:hypothetical protein